MNRLIFIFFISISLLSACENSIKKPDNLIPEEEMALILADVMLLEATYNTKLIRVENKNELMRKFSAEILANHDVTKEAFDASYEYYVEEPEDFENILELVFEELNKMETESSDFNDKKEPTDSILVSD